MTDFKRIGLNRIASPEMSLEDYMQFAARLGFGGIELRNDLPGGLIADALDGRRVKGLADRAGIRILSINALQRFNDKASMQQVLADNLTSMLEYGSSIGAEAVVLCPVNDAEEARTHDQVMHDTLRALKTFGPFFRKFGLHGFIEPLGFPACSLRFKRDAIAAIDESGFSDIFAVVHDTFHHHLSGEKEFYPDRTGLVHLSGVTTDKAPSQMTDGDRVLVTGEDLVGNRDQVRTLVDGGYTGSFSYEPFSATIQRLDAERLRDGLSASVAYLFS